MAVSFLPMMMSKNLLSHLFPEENFIQQHEQALRLGQWSPSSRGAEYVESGFRAAGGNLVWWLKKGIWFETLEVRLWPGERSVV